MNALSSATSLNGGRNMAGQRNSTTQTAGCDGIWLPILVQIDECMKLKLGNDHRQTGGWGETQESPSRTIQSISSELPPLQQQIRQRPRPSPKSRFVLTLAKRRRERMNSTKAKGEFVIVIAMDDNGDYDFVCGAIVASVFGRSGGRPAVDEKLNYFSQESRPICRALTAKDT